MALIRAKWRKLDAVVASEESEATRDWLKDLDESELERGVYVIRFYRPFTIAYPKSRSPVLYIGEGETKTRLESHLKGWIKKLGSEFPNAKIDARICNPRVQKNAQAYREVEADLLSRFVEYYGAMPLYNKNKEYFGTPNEYTHEFAKVLNPGSGKGFNWALCPIGRGEPRFREFKAWREVVVRK